ncbi:MAG: Crp/Fnr family transcriptional regulator [Deltaproteobacteria bacterium]
MLDYSSLVGVGATAHSFDAGEKVFKQDDPAIHLYVVRSGRIQIVTYGTVLENVGPGGVFGEMALIDEAPRSAAAVAKEPTEVLELSRAQFLALIQETPEFALHIMAVLANRIRRMNESL